METNSLFSEPFGCLQKRPTTPQHKHLTHSRSVNHNKPMIRYLVVQNRQGKVRLSKWYVPFEFEEKIKLALEIHRSVNSRLSKFTNFIEFKNHKIVYRRYAGLYFCLGVDPEDNELAMLEEVHMFVEVLDSYFGLVCELDLVFNFHKVYALLDELIVGGEIMEPSKAKVLQRIEELDNLP